MENNELMHWGVKGMKWGVRRYQNADGSLTPKGVKRYGHDDYRKAHSKKKVKHMSDKELADRNKRLQAERQYKDLTRKKNIGETAVKKFISVAGTITAATAAYGVYKGLANKGIDKIGDMIISSIDLTKPFA